MDAPAPAAPNVRRAALAFIFVTVLVDVMAFGLIIPVLPHLLKQVTGGEIADATMWHGLFATGFMVMQFFASPVQGALSDRFGRRPVILVSNAGIASAAPLEDTSLEIWQRNQNILVTGYFLASRAAFRLMKRQQTGGAMVFVASKNGLVASAGASAYCTAKAADSALSS